MGRLKIGFWTIFWKAFIQYLNVQSNFNKKSNYPIRDSSSQYNYENVNSFRHFQINSSTNCQNSIVIKLSRSKARQRRKGVARNRLDQKKRKKTKKGEARKNTRKEREREKKEINERKNADDRLEVIKRRSSVIKRMNLKKRGGLARGGIYARIRCTASLGPAF